MLPKGRAKGPIQLGPSDITAHFYRWVNRGQREIKYLAEVHNRQPGLGIELVHVCMYKGKDPLQSHLINGLHRESYHRRQKYRQGWFYARPVVMYANQPCLSRPHSGSEPENRWLVNNALKPHFVNHIFTTYQMAISLTRHYNNISLNSNTASKYEPSPHRPGGEQGPPVESTYLNKIYKVLYY